MNIEEGARALEHLAKEGVLQVPAGFVTFHGPDFPNFSDLYGDQPFTIKVGIEHQGWNNGTLASILYRERMLVSDNVAPAQTVVGKYDLTPSDAPSFLENACKQLSPLSSSGPVPYWQVRQEDLVGVSYISWDPTKGSDNEMVGQTFFVGTQGPRQLFQYGVGHYDGWDLPGNLRELELESGPYAPIHDFVVRARDFVEETTSGGVCNIIMEGLIMRGSYPVIGPMFIDLYALPGETLPDTLGHQAVLDHWRAQSPDVVRVLSE